jgi:pimeloyl-ACP methyl ester carboxylesterase
MGGGVVGTFASIYPDRVANLACIAPACMPIMRRTTPWWLALLLRVGPSILLETIVRRVLLEAGSTPAAQGEEWASPAGPHFDHDVAGFIKETAENQALPRSIVSTLRHFPMGETSPAFATWARHNKPTLVVWGQEDGVCLLEGSESLMPLVPHAKLVIIPKGKHMVVVEFAEQVADALLDFFA